MTTLSKRNKENAKLLEKGKVIFEAAVTGLIEVIREWQLWPIAERMDQHTGPVQKHIRW